MQPLSFLLLDLALLLSLRFVRVLLLLVHPVLLLLNRAGALRLFRGVFAGEVFSLALAFPFSVAAKADMDPASIMIARKRMRVFFIGVSPSWVAGSTFDYPALSTTRRARFHSQTAGIFLPSWGGFDKRSRT
jgi:hypothetical protein